MEHVKGKIYANIFQSNDILKMDYSGKVEMRYDFSELLRIEQKYNTDHDIHWSYYDMANNVLNGIAYHAPTDTFFITGPRCHSGC